MDAIVYSAHLSLGNSSCWRELSSGEREKHDRCVSAVDPSLSMAAEQSGWLEVYLLEQSASLEDSNPVSNRATVQPQQ